MIILKMSRDDTVTLLMKTGGIDRSQANSLLAMLLVLGIVKFE